MEIVLQRFNPTKQATQGLLFVDGKFSCYTLEDIGRPVKVKGETRIPAGRYQVKLRAEGGFHKKYAGMFPEMHAGMLHITNVPGFEYVLIHIGNHKGDTEGCILVGLNAPYPGTDTVIEKSKAAYEMLYKKVLSAFDRGDTVYITVRDEGGLVT